MNMTGHWRGLYTYPWGQEVGFEAEIVEIADRLDGSTAEPGLDGPPAPASLTGRRNADLVSFTKTYAQPGYADPVRYAGVMSSDGQEVEGTWTIRGGFSGGFLMIRSEPVRAPAAEKVGAKA